MEGRAVGCLNCDVLKYSRTPEQKIRKVTNCADTVYQFK